MRHMQRDTKDQVVLGTLVWGNLSAVSLEVDASLVPLHAFIWRGMRLELDGPSM